MLKHSSGFAPILLIVVAALALSASVGAYFYLTRTTSPATKSPPKKSEPMSTSSADTTATPPALPSPIPIVPPPPAPKISGGTVKVHLTEGNDNNTNNSLSQPTKFQIVIHDDAAFKRSISGVSDWTSPLIPEGSYFVDVYYQSPFAEWQSDCDNCFDEHNNSSTYRSSVQLTIKNNQTSTVKFKYKNFVTPILEPPKQATNDHKAPITNIFYPAQGGTISYKTDGKVCAYESAPTDSPDDQVTTHFAFDGGSFQTATGYLCADSLPNGSHSLAYYSTDQWGNTESTRTLSFSVNIMGN